jgi:hypothetical protein
LFFVIFFAGMTLGVTAGADSDTRRQRENGRLSHFAGPVGYGSKKREGFKLLSG